MVHYYPPGTRGQKVRFTYNKRGENLIGTADVHTPKGNRHLRVLVPLREIRQQVNAFVRDSEVSGDPRVTVRVGAMVEKVATEKARRRLITAIKLMYGGKVPPYEIAGPASYAERISRQAANKADIGWNPFKAVAKVATAVGKGVAKGTVAAGKAVGSGTVAAGKAVGSGTVAVAKGAGKVAIVAAPLAVALVQTLPAGNSVASALNFGKLALDTLHKAKGGDQEAQQAIQEIKTASLVDPQAAQAMRAINNLSQAQQQPQPDKTNSGMSMGTVAAIAGAGLAAVVLMGRK